MTEGRGGQPTPRGDHWDGQDAESPPLIRQTLPARTRRPSPKSPGDVLPLPLRHEARQSTPSLPTWFPSVRCGRRTASASIGRCVFASFPSQKIQWLGWIMHHVMTMGCPGSPHLGRPFPSVAKHVSWTASNPTKDAVISPLQAQHDATRGAHARSPLPASIKMPLSNLAGRPPPTTYHDASEATGSEAPCRKGDGGVLHAISIPLPWELGVGVGVAGGPPTPLPSLSIHRSFGQSIPCPLSIVCLLPCPWKHRPPPRASDIASTCIVGSNRSPGAVAHAGPSRPACLGGEGEPAGQFVHLSNQRRGRDKRPGL